MKGKELLDLLFCLCLVLQIKGKELLVLDLLCGWEGEEQRRPLAIFCKIPTAIRTRSWSCGWFPVGKVPLISRGEKPHWGQYCYGQNDDKTLKAVLAMTVKTLTAVSAMKRKTLTAILV